VLAGRVILSGDAIAATSREYINDSREWIQESSTARAIGRSNAYYRKGLLETQGLKARFPGHISPLHPTPNPSKPRFSGKLGRAAHVHRGRTQDADFCYFERGMPMRLGVVGYGVVGSAMVRLFAQFTQHEVVIFDKFLPMYSGSDQKLAINRCEVVFLCVPTPTAADGESCDTSAVEDCVDWITAPMCIRSTVVPGTVDRLSTPTRKPIAFSPEYLGEQPTHPWRNEGSCGFVIIGGPLSLCELVASAYQGCLGPDTKYYYTSARTAELCKYMENCFLASKVAFVNQFYEIATAFGVSFEELRRLWLADPRIGSSHTVVTEERGFRGRCLPKDLAAMVAAMAPLGGAPLLKAVQSYNQSLCEATDRAKSATSDRHAGDHLPQ